MTTSEFFSSLPSWVMFVASMVVVLLSIEGGQLFARLHKREKEETVGSVVAAALGLLAFMLAFTFGIAANRREMRRDLLLEEVNAIHKTFLRTDLIPEPQRTEVRRLLREYVDIRLDVYDHPEQLKEALVAAEHLHIELWKNAAALANANLKNADIAALFVDSLNETINLQTRRVIVGGYRVPVVIWSAFCVLTVISMLTVGYHFGQAGKGNLPMQLALAVSFSVVVFLISDLDRANEGWLKVSNQPMVKLQQQLEG